MSSQRKTIITCAITGAIHTPSMSPYLPVTPDEIAQSAIEAAEAVEIEGRQEAEVLLFDMAMQLQ